MAESDSAEGATAESGSGEGSMAKSSNLMWQARNILATPSHKGVGIVLEQLSMREETSKYQSALALYKFCVRKFPNCLTLMLLKVYRFSTNGVVRFRSIKMLSDTLAELRHSGLDLSIVALREIKPLLVSCLGIQETEESDIKILRRIVSHVAYNVVISDNSGWDELANCISSLANTQPLKAFHIFLDLPPLYGKFINSFMETLLDRVYKVLVSPEKNREEDWILALETGVKMGIQLLDSDPRFDLVKNILTFLVKSANDLMEKGMGQLLQRGLLDLEKFLLRDKYLYNYNKSQNLFVSSIAFKLKETGTYTKEVVMIIDRLVKFKDNQPIKLDPSLLQSQEANEDHGAVSEHLQMLTPLELLKIFASTDLQERFREMAIRRLNNLLTDHTLTKVVIDDSVIRDLQPVLMACLWEEGITESMFKVLGQVVYHVAHEMFSIQYDTWDGLRNYVVSKSKTDFERAVYIFQSVPMPLKDEEIVVPMINTLLPEISSRMNPPEELLVDNSGWVLAFTGAFCALIHLIEETNHVVKEVTYKMIESVKNLVERGMEVGVVRRAFRDLEILVKKHLKWYSTSQYKYLKGLLWKLYEIKGMKMESKMVLWRINLILEKGVSKQDKELPRDDLH